jgi:hypothetical protein
MSPRPLPVRCRCSAVPVGAWPCCGWLRLLPIAQDIVVAAAAALRAAAIGAAVFQNIVENVPKARARLLR